MKGDLEQSGPFLAIGGMAVAFFLYAYVAIALPGWMNTLLLPLLWLVLLVVAIRWFTARPRLAVAVPVVAVAAWFVVMLTR